MKTVQKLRRNIGLASNKAPWLIVIFGAVMIEGFVFNFRFWQSLSYSSYDLIDAGSYSLDDGQYSEDSGIVIPFRENGLADFTAYIGDMDVNNLYIKCNYIWTWEEDYADSQVALTIKASDEGNANLYMPVVIGRRTYSGDRRYTNGRVGWSICNGFWLAALPKHDYAFGKRGK